MLYLSQCYEYTVDFSFSICYNRKSIKLKPRSDLITRFSRKLDGQKRD